MYLIILIVILIFLYIITVIEKEWIKVTHYTITNDKLPKEFYQTNFIVLADLHNHSFGKNNRRLIKKIENLTPDFIIIAGDMITKHKPCYPSTAYDFLEQLAKNNSIYYALGNHEQEMTNQHCSTWIEYKENLIKHKVQFLDNESIQLEKGKGSIRITGLTIDKDYFSRKLTKTMTPKYLEELIKEKPDHQYHILIAHNPTYFEQYASWGADLTLSGHNHGGLIRIPGIGGVISPQVKLFPKYDAGYFTNNINDMIISRGLGSHSFMLRLFNPPEIVSITLNKPI